MVSLPILGRRSIYLVFEQQRRVVDKDEENLMKIDEFFKCNTILEDNSKNHFKPLSTESKIFYYNPLLLANRKHGIT